jgi:hypothetical protein
VRGNKAGGKGGAVFIGLDGFFADQSTLAGSFAPANDRLLLDPLVPSAALTSTHQDMYA